MANFWGGWTPPRHSGTWAGARVASLRCHYPPPRRSQYSRNAKAQPHKSKTSCRGGHRRGTTTSGPGCGPLAGFEVTLYGRFWGDRRGSAKAQGENWVFSIARKRCKETQCSLFPICCRLPKLDVAGSLRRFPVIRVPRHSTARSGIFENLTAALGTKPPPSLARDLPTA